MADDETLATLRQFRVLIDRLLNAFPSATAGPPLLDVLEAHLGTAPETLPAVTESIAPYQFVDADLALEAVARRDPDHRVIGVGASHMQQQFLSFAALLQEARRVSGAVVAPVDYVRLATGPNQEDDRNAVAAGVHLFRYGGFPMVVRQQGPDERWHRQEATLEVVGEDPGAAKRLLAEVRTLMRATSVLRGKVVTFGTNPYGRGLPGITFVPRPSVEEEQVVLPAGTLDRLLQHVVGIGAGRAQLQAHGQHLKRGVLLYGAPGTGKTHTIRHLLTATPETTAVLLAGESLRFVHEAALVAREHQPSIVVLEDCDLIAQDRSLGPAPGQRPLLFEVLDALDGLDEDADVAFLLTTNRVQDLERALAQRPGRVDLAIEIPLPDQEARARLLRLYGASRFGAAALADVAARAEGTTAAFAKELVRRAVMRAVVEGARPADSHLRAALDELLDDTEALTRSLLGVEGPQC